MASDKLHVLQSFRGIAASMVVVHHALNSLLYYHPIRSSFLLFLCHLGKYGVDFFFVLSGFILTYAFTQKKQNSVPWHRFILARFIRVYVPFLPISLALYFFYTYYPHFSNGSRDLSLWTSLTLFPSGKPSLSVAWTLSHEILFYLLFSVMYIGEKYWKILCTLWVIGIGMGYVVFHESTKNTFFGFVFSPYNVEFLVGYGTAKFYLQRKSIAKEIYLALLVLIFSLIVFLLWNQWYPVRFFTNFLVAIMSALLILKFINSTWTPPRILLFSGMISYSIYLIHNPVQIFIVRLLPEIHSLILVFIVLLLILFVVHLMAWIYYQIFENSVTNQIKKRV